MVNFRLFRGLFLLAVAGSISCTKNTLNLPEPAQTLAGTYQLQATNARLPIQGDKLTLTLKPVANDTVSIVLSSSLNGQVIDSLTYQNAPVEQNFDTSLIVGVGVIQSGCISYAIYLTPKKNSEFLKMTCSDKNVFYYYYTPVGQTGVTFIKFKKV